MLFGHADKILFQSAGLAAVAIQLGSCAAEDQCAAVQYLDAVAYTFDFAEQVCGEDYAVGVAKLADQGAYFAYLGGIEADGGLVEHDHVGAVDDGLCDADALLIAFGQRADDFFSDSCQAAVLFGPAKRICYVGLHAAQAGGKDQVIIHVKFAVQGRSFRQIADMRLGLHRFVQQVNAADFDVASLCFGIVRQQATRQHLQRGALAGPVVPEQAQNFTAF